MGIDNGLSVSANDSEHLSLRRPKRLMFAVTDNGYMDGIVILKHFKRSSRVERQQRTLDPGQLQQHGQFGPSPKQVLQLADMKVLRE